LKVTGFVGKPEYAKKSRSEQFFFVNNRFIKSGYLHHAVMAAYEGILPVGAQPSYFLYLDVPPNTIDINIHPTKTEIKFDDEQALYAILRSTIKHSLGQFNVVPALDFDRDSNLDTPYDYKDKEASTPTIQVDRSYNPFSNDKPNKTYTPPYYPKKEGSWESLYIGTNQTSEIEIDATSIVNFENDEEITASLFDENNEEKQGNRTYQVHRKYIVNPIKSGMLIVNQHRAHQRILYEQFLTNMTVHQASSQQLLFPINLYFSKDELELIEELKQSLVNTGFVFEENTQEYIVLSGLPANVSEKEASLVLEHLISDLQDGIPENSFSQNDTIARSMAKSLAIKTGAFLTEKEQENLVNGLFACKEPTTTPFQKPTFITMRVEDIDRKFTL
jgi:DNA mismatch repair protein MutL